MKQTINEYQFHRAFEKMGRGNQFSYDGLTAIFNDLEEYEDSTGDAVELDVIAICCEYSEYKNLKEFQADYGEEYESMEDVMESTHVIPVERTLYQESFIIQQF